MYAVITGDVAGSSRFEGEERQKLLAAMKQSFAEVTEICGSEAIAFPFEIFRGDSFQGVFRQPQFALKAGIIIRANLRKSFRTTLRDAVDARIAVGIGTISMLPDGRGGEGDGQAYRNSGPLLDKMLKDSRLLRIVTPWDVVNQELEVECALADTIVSRWSSLQAEVVIEFWKGKTQEQMAGLLNISQPGIRKRIQATNIMAVDVFDKRFSGLLAHFIQLENENYNLTGL